MRIAKAEWAHKAEWAGRTILVAPGFLHELRPGDEDPRTRELFERLQRLGYRADTEGISRFQEERGLKPSGRLDWKTILVIDALAAPGDRPHLSCPGESPPPRDN